MNEQQERDIEAVLDEWRGGFIHSNAAITRVAAIMGRTYQQPRTAYVMEADGKRLAELVQPTFIHDQNK